MPVSDPIKVLRFAPSPNGYLHIGHAYSALVNQRLAGALGGRLLLRMEDIDAERCRKEFETAIEEDLTWLGLEWERPPRRQSEHMSDYARALDDLRKRGLAYPCFCSRGDIARAVSARADWPRDPDGVPLYSGACRHLSAAERDQRLASGQSAALRIDMVEALSRLKGPLGWREYHEGAVAKDVLAEPALWGDAMIGRRDVAASYHIAVVVDDALQGITDVARGMDLFNATGLHRILQTLLGLPAPNYRHHEVLRDEAGAKLSKSARAKSVRALRGEGVSAVEIRRRLGFARD